MKKFEKRLVSFLLAAVLVIGLMPSQALATDGAASTVTDWSGATAVFVGDSITYGTGTDKTYHAYIDEMGIFQSVQAMGVAGSCISAQSDYGSGNSPLIDRYSSIPDADLIVVFMGTNDYGHETPLGTASDSTDISFYGALNVIIPGIQAQHPNSQLVFATPLHRYGFGTSKILGTAFTYDHIANGNGYTLADYVEAIKAVCGKYSVPVIDLHNQYTVDPTDSADRTAYMPDGLHPNAAGHEILAELIFEGLQTIPRINGDENEEEDDTTQTQPDSLQHGNKFVSDYADDTTRASSVTNLYLKAGQTVTFLKSGECEWALAKTDSTDSTNYTRYYPDNGWNSAASYTVAEDGYYGLVLKKNDGSAFDFDDPNFDAVSDYILVSEPDTDGKKTISILGASMSTYTGISNNANTNSTIGSNAVYYTEGRYGVYAEDTWWMQAANDLNLRLLVNNSWSGSSLLYERNGTVGAYVDRCVQLHDDTGDNAGEMPDIIAIQMGTNDFQYYKDTLGTADIDYDALITGNGDGSYTYATPTTSLEAAAIVLHKISVRYPDAEVYYLNISQRIDGTDDLIQTFNADLAAVCQHFGVTIVDIYNSGITMENFDTYIGDGRVHPNCLGMDAYTEAFKKAYLGNHSEKTAYTVDFRLENVEADYGVDKAVLAGNAFTCTLTAPENYKVDVTVTIGGNDITESCYADGKVTIGGVTGPVVIKAEAVLDHESADYRWEFDGSDLVCVSGDNDLTKNAGTTTDGVFSSTRYALETAVVLSHAEPWSVEWKCEGTFKNTGSSGARIFTTTDANAEYNARYIFKSNNSGLIAMGEKTTTGSHNYGIALADHDIDWTQLHTYRLENRIADDGSNMVWLYVDGVEIGPMNNYYVGTTDKNTTSDWLSGKDFIFPYMGTDTHGFNNASIDYVQVWEGGADHYHAYTAVVTDPTYTEGGYTTYTCAGCGDSYVSDYTDPITLHSYRWELTDDALVSVTTDGNIQNTLTLENGSITDGQFSNVLYSMDGSIHLYHDRPWVIEFKSTGDCARENSTVGGAAMLSSNTVLQSEEGTWFLYKRPVNGLIALCYRDKTNSTQSGIALTDHNIDASTEHTYRLENRVAADGSNMVWLYVDGTEIGAMNNLFVSAVDQEETTDFLNGLDWTFDYMGVTNYYLNNCSVEYMQVWEGGHTHSYESVVTLPTGTEKGYTTYTCVCGDSYRTAWLDESAYEGMTIACIGDSITYGVGVTQGETDYVTLLADKLGMDYIRLGASGTTLCTDGSRTCNIDKLTENKLQGADIVTIAMGINDFCAAGAGYYELGDINSTDSSTIYGAVRMWCERIVELRKTDSLKDTQFYFVTPLITSWNNSVTSAKNWDQSKTNIHGYTLRDLCNAILEVAALYDVAVIDLNLISGLYYVDAQDNNIDVFGGDGVHPGDEGHAMMAAALTNALLQNDLRNDHTHIFGSWITTTWPSCVAGEEQRVCSVCSATESSTLEANGCHRYAGVVTPPTNTQQGYTTYTCTICGDSYVGDYTEPIAPKSYRWEMQDNALVSVTTGSNTANALTLDSGSVTDGTLNSVRYSLQNKVRLYHDLPWVIEWCSSGNWDGMLFGSTMDSSVQGLTYLFRYASMHFLAFGEYTGTWNNYGIIHDIDMTVSHVFRLENRIGEDGSNTVYLLVDGEEVGALNHYYAGGTDKNQIVNWVNGRDLVFANVGTSTHAVNSMKLEYLQVWEGGHTHSYENGICAVCGAEHPELADYEGKVISIMGDSISTFAGYIPVADGFNLEHLARYPQDDLLTDVNETWWMQVVAGLDAKLGINDSWRGATLSGGHPVTTGTTGENAAMSNLIRIQNLGSNGTPDVILLYGGTNDLAHVSKVGTFDPATAPTEVDLTTKKWDNLADGFVHTILRMRHYYPDAVIVAMLPTYTASYYSDEKLAQGNAVMAAICEHYGIAYVDLRDSGVTAELLPDGIHPGEEGMDLITSAVIDTLLSDCTLEPGEHVVYPVSHNLTNVTAALGHWNGVDAGGAFAETLSGDILSVTVTMNGADVTEDVYQDGVISIEAVTGALVVTAKGRYDLDGHLQQLPEKAYNTTNIWDVLEHDEEYYSVDGWVVHASGKVKSVTVPMTAGDRIRATSFGAAGTNGGTINGIRVTYFSEEGLLKTMGADEVYKEFSEKGYLTVPEGAVAVSVPMWAEDGAEMYILTLPALPSEENVHLSQKAKLEEDGSFTFTLEIYASEKVALYEDAVIRYVLANGFVMTQKSEVKAVRVSELLNGAVLYEVTAEATELTVTVDDGIVDVTGFDLSENYIAQDHAGCKLVITISKVEATEAVVWGDNMDLSTADSGIWAEGAMAVPFTKGMAFFRESVYVMDYAQSLTLDEEGILHLDAEGMGCFNEPKTGLEMAYGTVAVQNGSIVYTPGTIKWEGYDRFFAFGKEELTYNWTKVAVIPANNVYYEDSFLATSPEDAAAGAGIYYTNGTKPEDLAQDVWESWHGQWESVSDNKTGNSVTNSGDVQGWIEDLAGQTGFTGGSAHLVQAMLGQSSSLPKATFTFTGTGVDIYSFTNNTTGTVLVQVKDTTGTYPGSYYIVDTGTNTAEGYYQVPTISFTGKGHSTYQVTIIVTVAAAAENRFAYYLDGIRVYNPLAADGKDDVVADAYGDEMTAVFGSVRQMLLDALSFTGDSGVGTGFVFLDRMPGEEQSGSTNVIGTYEVYGPKNEVYLAKGQAIAFKVDEDLYSRVQVGLKSLTGEEVQAVVSYFDEETSAAAQGLVSIAHTADLYYELTPMDGYVVIRNTGDAVLAVTKVKLMTSGDPQQISAQVEKISQAQVLAAVEEFDALPVTAYSLRRNEPDLEITVPDISSDELAAQKLQALVEKLFGSVNQWMKES